ncbi:hypothetical protein EDB89DRAFT_2187600 [Lactarius sanguifluus]|nr:hypothetical protein EDB89DRAFT_2187600 [Lactarius sanguifluus]
MPEPHAAVFSSKLPGGEFRVERTHKKFYTIEDIPEEVILDIFYFHKLSHKDGSREWQEKLEWHKLAQVCRRWRTIIFASQHRLGLWLLCTPKTSVARIIDLWPNFRIVVRDTPMCLFLDDNITAALQQRDRVCEISLHVNGLLFERVSQLVQGSFPLLEHLSLRSGEKMERVLPSTSLDGSAPRLRILWLNGITFPALPRLLSSARDLVNLQIRQRVPSTEYISPEALVSGLSAATRLELLLLSLKPAKSHSNPKNPPPPSGRIVLPTLNHFSFNGTCNYLEDLLSRISAPSLKRAGITYLDPPGSDVLQLSRFLGRMEPQWLPHLVEVLFSKTCTCLSYPMMALQGFTSLCWLEQIPPSLSSVRTLKIEAFFQSPALGNSENIAQWLDLFRVFNRVEQLVIVGDASASFACALQRVSVEMAADLLPVLREIYLGSATSESRKAVTSFIEKRNLAGLPDVKFTSSRHTKANVTKSHGEPLSTLSALQFPLRNSLIRLLYGLAHRFGMGISEAVPSLFYSLALSSVSDPFPNRLALSLNSSAARV